MSAAKFIGRRHPRRRHSVGSRLASSQDHVSGRASWQRPRLRTYTLVRTQHGTDEVGHVDCRVGGRWKVRRIDGGDVLVSAARQPFPVLQSDV